MTDRKLDQTNQIQRLDETETETQTTQDRTTQDLTAPRVRTADESQIQVGAETAKLLQASIVEPKIHFFPSDCYDAEFDPACIELLPNFRDPIKISDQITCQESKYSLCDFDAGPPLKSGSSDNVQLRDILNGGNVSTYLHEFSHLSLNQSSRYYCDSLPFLEVHVEKLSIKQGSQTERNNKSNIARASVATSLAILRFALIKLSVISKHRK